MTRRDADMPFFSTAVASAPGSLIGGPGRIVFFLVLCGAGLPLSSAYGQVDTIEVVPPTSIEPLPVDTTQPPEQDTQEVQEPLDPLPPASPTYGRPQTDSLPGRMPHVGFGHILARQPGSFLYDLGAVGWPHGWSPRGLAPHRSSLWLDGVPYNDPLTGRPRLELIPPSFQKRPRTGVDPAGQPVGIHIDGRDYDQARPITELRYRRDSRGLHSIEVGHSQKRRLSLFDTPGLLQITFGYGGRKAEGAYEGSDLRSERRLWGRLRYETNDWRVELNDRSARHRIGTHGGVHPPGPLFSSIFTLPLAATRVHNPEARRRTFRNDLTARLRGPLLPLFSAPASVSATWTSNTFDFETDYGNRVAWTDTTWTVKLNGGHGRIQQPFSVGAHHFTLSGRGSLWKISRGNVPQIDGTRWSAHALVRDSVRAGSMDITLDAGWHATQSRSFPSSSAQMSLPVGPVHVSASLSMTGQQASWIAEEGFSTFVRPLSTEPSPRVYEGRIEASVERGPVDATLEGFAHQLQDAVDLYAFTDDSPVPPSTITDTVVARRTSGPVQRAGATLSLGWRRDARRGVYATGQGTALQLLNPDASPLHNRLAYTVPSVFGRARLGARFVLFQDLITDLYLEGRGWSQMNSRWFHPPSGRLVVPHQDVPVPAVPGLRVGPSGTVDLHAEAQLRGATLFFTFENVQASSDQRGSLSRQASLHHGTFVVPVYPLPARKFRFGVFWPIFD